MNPLGNISRKSVLLWEFKGPCTNHSNSSLAPDFSYLSLHSNKLFSDQLQYYNQCVCV